MALPNYVFKPYNPNNVRLLTSIENFPSNVSLVHARMVYFVLFQSASFSFAGSLLHLVLLHQFKLDFALVNFLSMIWWVSYFRSKIPILISVIGASFFFGLTVGGRDFATYMHLNERTSLYALASITLLFGSQMAAMFTRSPAVVFNCNIVALPLFIYVLVFAQLFFSFPFKPNDSPPLGVFMTYIHHHILGCSLIFFFFIASAWFSILIFLRVSNLTFKVLVPAHLHVLSVLIFLSGYSVYYVTGVYTALFFFVYNVRYHAFDTMFPQPNELYQVGVFPQVHSSVLSFFTLFLGRSTYILSHVSEILGRISHMEFRAIWVSAITYGLRVWRACCAFYRKIIQGGTFIVRWSLDFMFKLAVVSVIFVVYFAILFAFRN